MNATIATSENRKNELSNIYDPHTIIIPAGEIQYKHNHDGQVENVLVIIHRVLGISEDSWSEWTICTPSGDYRLQSGTLR